MPVVEVAVADVAIEMESYIRKEWIEAISAGSRSRLYFCVCREWRVWHIVVMSSSVK